MVDGGYPKIDYVMELEGLDKVCKYAVGMGKDHPSNPHRHEVRVRKPIHDDITDVIGNTPMVRINNISKAEGIKCELCKSKSSLILIKHSG
jgi:hypothetical protein